MPYNDLSLGIRIQQSALSSMKKKNRQSFYYWKRDETYIKGMETIRGIYKKNRRNGTLFGFSVSTEIKILMGISA